MSGLGDMLSFPSRVSLALACSLPLLRPLLLLKASLLLLLLLLVVVVRRGFGWHRNG